MRGLGDGAGVSNATHPAALFPGQGSHTPEMRELVAQRAPDLLERVTELVGEDPFARVEENTRFAQPAIFCASLAGWDALELTRPPAPATRSASSPPSPPPACSSARTRWSSSSCAAS